MNSALLPIRVGGRIPAGQDQVKLTIQAPVMASTASGGQCNGWKSNHRPPGDSGG
jgi:hypothetical protein